MIFKRRILTQNTDMICGNYPKEESYFLYRSSSFLTEFFSDADTDYVHDGSIRAAWLADTLNTILLEPSIISDEPNHTFLRVIQVLMDSSDAINEDNRRLNALDMLNNALEREGFEAFYADDKKMLLKAQYYK